MSETTKLNVLFSMETLILSHWQLNKSNTLNLTLLEMLSIGSQNGDCKVLGENTPLKLFKGDSDPYHSQFKKLWSPMLQYF